LAAEAQSVSCNLLNKHIDILQLTE